MYLTIIHMLLRLYYSYIFSCAFELICVPYASSSSSKCGSSARWAAAATT